MTSQVVASIVIFSILEENLKSNMIYGLFCKAHVADVLIEALIHKNTPIPSKTTRLMLVSNVLHNSSALLNFLFILYFMGGKVIKGFVLEHHCIKSLKKLSRFVLYNLLFHKITSLDSQLCNHCYMCD